MNRNLFRHSSMAIVCLMVATLVAIACTSQAPAPAAPAGSEPPVSQVAAGVGERTVVGAAFAPQHITVPVGSTVSWTVASHEVHMVTFYGAGVARPEGSPRQLPATIKLDAVTPVDGAAYLNTGVMQKDTKVDFTFPKAGTFTYYCPIHEGMYGTVQVAPAGQPYTTVSLAQAIAKTESDVLLGSVEALRQEALARATKKALADGSTEWTVITGPLIPMPTGYLQLKEYFPRDIQIKKGDSIKWVFETGHSVTFLPPGEKLASPAPPYTKPSPEYDGKSLYTSAVPPRTGQGNPIFELKFPTAGNFPYLCQLHWERLGHIGTVLVQ